MEVSVEEIIEGKAIPVEFESTHWFRLVKVGESVLGCVEVVEVAGVLFE